MNFQGCIVLIQNIMKYYSLSLLLGLLLFVTSCGGDSTVSSEPEKKGDGFDRTAMLTHWIDDFIIPYNQKFSDAATALEEKTKAFNANPNEANLNAARTALHGAYKAYQYIGFYRFGKAEASDMNFQHRLNTYPINTDKIKSNAIEKNYQFRLYSQISQGSIAQGLPAVDYLLNGFGDNNQAILEKYTTDANAQHYKDYLYEVTKEMVLSSKEMLADLKTNRPSFINNTGNNASGSVSLVANAYVQYYERHLRAGKIGYPAGILTPMFLEDNEQPKPHLVESQFSPQHNRAYALLGTKAMHEFFQGIGADGKTGKSFQQYIEYMATKNSNHKTLAQDINNQFTQAEMAIQALNPNFQVQITQDLNKLKNAYYNLQKNVPHLKVDMAQSLNITISYADTDGD